MDARGVVWGLRSDSNPNEGHPKEHLGIASNQNRPPAENHLRGEPQCGYAKIKTKKDCQATRSFFPVLKQPTIYLGGMPTNAYLNEKHVHTCLYSVGFPYSQTHFEACASHFPLNGV